MKLWSKKAIAHHFGVSLTTVDNWIRTGCPTEPGANGRISGMHFGDVVDWLQGHRDPDVRRRGHEAVYAKWALMGIRLAFIHPGPYLELLRGAGLTDEQARDVYRRLLRQIGEPVSQTFRVPADEFVDLADLDERTS